MKLTSAPNVRMKPSRKPKSSEPQRRPSYRAPASGGRGHDTCFLHGRCILDQRSHASGSDGLPICLAVCGHDLVRLRRRASRRGSGRISGRALRHAHSHDRRGQHRSDHHGDGHVQRRAKSDAAARHGVCGAHDRAQRHDRAVGDRRRPEPPAAAIQPAGRGRLSGGYYLPLRHLAGGADIHDIDGRPHDDDTAGDRVRSIDRAALWRLPDDRNRAPSRLLHGEESGQSRRRR